MYISVIVGLSAMGIGYGYWMDSLNVGVSVTTGYMRPEFISDGVGTLSGDGKTISIYREVYKGQSVDISVEIINASSIPINFEDSQMGVNETTFYNLSIPMPEDESGIQESSLVYQEEIFNIEDGIPGIQLEIDNIQEEINNIQAEIIRLNKIEDHKFEKNLTFEQGI